jgi:hypothetical protein
LIGACVMAQDATQLYDDEDQAHDGDGKHEGYA